MAILGDDVRIVGRRDHQIEENTTPPFLGPVFQCVVSGHLVTKVYALHVFLIVLNNRWDGNLTLLGGSGAAIHFTNLSRIMEVRKKQHWFGISPNAVCDLVFLCESVFVFVDVRRGPCGLPEPCRNHTCHSQVIPRGGGH